jgi:outer membrane receptor protein involved in Fe transport
MKRRLAYSVFASVIVLGSKSNAQALAKPLELASREPAFYAIVGSHIERAEARNVAVLRKHIALSLHNATIPEALSAIEGRTLLRFAFKPSILPPDETVSLDARDISVAAALTQILLDADVDVEIAPYGLASIVSRQPRKAAPDSTTGTIVGSVTDSKTHVGIPYATVSVEGTGRSTTANDSGAFRLARVPAGSHMISTRRVGYVAAQRSVTVVSGQVSTVDIVLGESANQLGQVVVTGTLAPAEVRSLPTPITVVSDSELAQQQSHSVNEIFRQNVPTGVSFDQFYKPNSTFLTVRGATDLNQGGTSVKVFIDGIEVAQSFASPVDPASIDHIEVIRGPEAAAIYGSGAIDGVIQIFTKHGNATQGRPSVDAQVAAADVQTPYPGHRGALRQTYSGDIRGGTQDAGYSVGGGYTQTNNYLPLGALSAQSTPSVYGGVHYTRAVTTLDVSARYHIVNAPSTYNPLLTITEPPSGPFGTQTFLSDAYANTTVGASLGVQPLPSWRNTFTIGYDENTWNEVQRRPHLSTPTDTELSYGYSSTNKISLKCYSSVTEHLGSALTGTLIAGADYWNGAELVTSSGGVFNTSGQIHTDPNQPFNTGRYLSWNTGLFAQGQIGIFDALFITAGLRADWNSNNGDSIGVPISPRVGIAYSHPLGFATIKLRSSWGSALLPPSSGEILRVATSYSIQLAAPHLGPERQHGGDGGFDLLFGQVGVFSATYFDQTAINLIQQVPLPGTPSTSQFQNVGTVTNTGLELEGKVFMGPASLRLMYGYTRSRVDKLAPGYSGDYQVGDQSFDVPRHNAGASLALRLWRGGSIAGGLTYVGPWTDYDWIKEFSCYSYFSAPQCPSSFLNALANGKLYNRAFLMNYPTMVKGNLSVTQALSPMLSAFISINNIGDNHDYEQNNIIPTVGRISTIGLRFHY